MIKYSLVISLLICSIVFESIGQEINSSPLDSNLCIHGEVMTYYGNGNPKSMKTYEHGFLYGNYEKYNRSGALVEWGFLDNVNVQTLFFQPVKSIKVTHGKHGFYDSIISEIIPIKKVPVGRCKCEDGNIKRIKSLLIGVWTKERMIPFDRSDKIIDSIFRNYDTQLIFHSNDSLTILKNGITQSGVYNFTSNTIDLKIRNDEGVLESIMSMRWPRKTLNTNSTLEHFNMELIELLFTMKKTSEIELSNVIVKFKRE